MALEISVFESVTLSELSQTITMPSLYQTGVGFVAGRTYRLSVESDVASGILNIYQGTQLIYSSSTVLFGNLSDFYDSVSVTERVIVDVIENSPSASLSPSKSASKSPSQSPSRSPSASVSPSLSPSV